ncbi:hypothetical protein GJ744_000893 [Endocarpon pusillum]|uniref:Uncharacterized protein n=1 Tax=Endocarpon pusillum TaxID=364733 RepID=A0A8H7ATG0_9EURO|nr:hypothetical protein GJ744_000893 [Endocarpon pusillum]
MSRPASNVGSGGLGNRPRSPGPAAFAGLGPHNEGPETPSRVGPGIAPGRMEESTPDFLFERKIQKFFDMAEAYCYAHMNFPSTAGDALLHPLIKDRLMKAATQESAHQLASTRHTRYLLMTKVVLMWIIRHIWTEIPPFEGFDLEADRRISNYKRQIYQTTPPLLRHHFLSRIAQDVQRIRAHPDFLSYFQRLVCSQATKLWAIVHPLMHYPTLPFDWEDLKSLIYTAYCISGEMWATPFEWRFDFTPVGTPYDPSMVNKDPYIKGTREELARRNLVVKLGITPAVYMRDSADGFARTAQLTSHQVLVKDA